MKIMIATAYYHPRIGGLENYAAAVADGLQRLGWEVVVVCGDLGEKNVRREQLNGYTVWRLPIWRVVSNTPLHPAWFRMIRKIIRSERPDIINAHTPVPYMVDIATIAAGQIPVIVTYHAASLFKPSSLLMRLLTLGYLAVESMTLRRARAIIAVSPHVKSALGKRLAHKIEVVPNAVASVSQERHDSGEGLVFVSNLEPSHAWKGLDAILDSLAISRDRYRISPRLIVIGDGSDRIRYQKRVNDLGLADFVHFAGVLTGPMRDKEMRQASAQVIYPTTPNDGMPTVLLEGWAQGVPVIAADVGPIASVVSHGKTGILVAPNDPGTLAAAISRFLNDPAEGRKMGEAARQLVEREYTWRRQVTRTDRLFKRLVESHRST